MNARKLAAGLLLAIALGLNPAAAASTNRLVNPGFETGDLTGWTVGGINGGFGVLPDGAPIPGVTSPIFLPARQNVHSGSFGAYAVTAGLDGEFVSFSQTIELEPGTYQAGFFLGNDEASAFGVAAEIDTGTLAIVVDGVRRPFNSLPGALNIPPGSGPDDFVFFSADFLRFGTRLTAIDFRISGSGTVRAGISVDDFSVIRLGPLPGAIPAPGAIALAALGAVLVLRRRIT